MEINPECTCKYCNNIYSEPVSLNCCKKNICKCHIEELLSIDESSTFLCPFCNVENANLNLSVNQAIQSLLGIQPYTFEIDSNYKLTLDRFKVEIKKLELLIKDPENYIYEKINELKWHADLDRERSKSQIEYLGCEIIQQLEFYERKFKSEYKSNVDFGYYNALLESSRQQMNEYEEVLNLFSAKKQERDEKSKQSEREMNMLQSKIKELKFRLFSNLSIHYKPIGSSVDNLFGKLVIKVRFRFYLA